MTGITGEEVDARIAHVPALLDWACGGEAHRKRGNYMTVTEDRDWHGYSSCGDLAHWLLYALGCRQAWINRGEHRSGDLGRPGWDVAVNVSRLAFSAPTSVRQSPMPGYMVTGPGDIIIVWNEAKGTDAHVMVAAAHQRLPGTLRVGEYGQPGGHIADRTVTARDGHLYCGRRRIQRWLPLHLVITDAAERDELADVALPWPHDTDPPEPVPDTERPTNA